MDSWALSGKGTGPNAEGASGEGDAAWNWTSYLLRDLLLDTRMSQEESGKRERRTHNMEGAWDDDDNGTFDSDNDNSSWYLTAEEEEAAGGNVFEPPSATKVPQEVESSELGGDTAYASDFNDQDCGPSEGSLACVSAINETLRAPYRLSYNPPLVQQPLMFWTEYEFAVVKEFVRMFPLVYPSITKLHLAESTDPEYSKGKLAELEAEYENAMKVEQKEEDDDQDEFGSCSKTRTDACERTFGSGMLNQNQHQVHMCEVHTTPLHPPPPGFPPLPLPLHLPSLVAPTLRQDYRGTDASCSKVKPDEAQRTASEKGPPVTLRRKHRVFPAPRWTKRLQSCYLLRINHYALSSPHHPHCMCQRHTCEPEPLWILKRLNRLNHRSHHESTVKVHKCNVARNLKLRRRMNHIHTQLSSLQETDPQCSSQQSDFRSRVPSPPQLKEGKFGEASKTVNSPEKETTMIDVDVSSKENNSPRYGNANTSGINNDMFELQERVGIPCQNVEGGFWNRISRAWSHVFSVLVIFLILVVSMLYDFKLD